MKAANDREEDSFDVQLVKKILGRDKRRLELWEEHLKDQLCVGQIPEVGGRSVSRLIVGSRLLWSRGCNNLPPDGFRPDPRCVGQAFVGSGPLAFS